MRRLIVGVDPGVTVGLAILGLDGVPVHIESRKGWALPELIKAISEVGEVTIVSTDVSQPSEIVQRLSAMLNAVLFTPLIPMNSEEKHQIAREYTQLYSLKLKNTHEVDALAAAVKAYQRYKNKFDQVEAKLKTHEPKISIEDVKNLIVRGHNLKKAIQILSGSGTFRMRTPLRRRILREEEMKMLIDELRKQLIQEKERSRRLILANRELRFKIKALKSEISRLKERVEEARSEQSAQIRREREYQMLREELDKARVRLAEYSNRLEEFKARFEEMQRLSEAESQGRLVMLKPVEAFTEKGLTKAFTLYNIKAGDLVFLLDPSGGGASTAETLAKRGVKAVVTKGPMSHQALEVFAKYMIPIVPSERLEVKWVGGMPYVDQERLRKVIKESSELEASMTYEEVKALLEEHRREVKEEKQI